MAPAVAVAGRRRREASGLVWLAPALLAYAAFYLVPLLRMVATSFGGTAPTLASYAHLLAEPIYATVFLITLKIALYVTAAALILGYPLAYYLSRLSGRGLLIGLAFVLLPFWTSVLVRNYAWYVLLARRGVINGLLMGLGLVGEPLPLLFNTTGVIIGMTYVLVPFMTLSLFSVMRATDTLYLKASASLGASPFESFWRVFLPLSLPGVYAGGLLVFITALGFFITPALLGGGRVPTIAVLIDDQVRGVLNFGLGSALGTLLLVAVLVAYYAFDRWLGAEHLFGERR